MAGPGRCAYRIKVRDEGAVARLAWQGPEEIALRQIMGAAIGIAWPKVGIEVRQDIWCYHIVPKNSIWNIGDMFTDDSDGALGEAFGQLAGPGSVAYLNQAGGVSTGVARYLQKLHPHYRLTGRRP